MTKKKVIPILDYGQGQGMRIFQKIGVALNVESQRHFLSYWGRFLEMSYQNFIRPRWVAGAL
jgi:hypothetical protein